MAELGPDRSRGEVQGWLAEERVTLQRGAETRTRLKPSFKLRAGDRLTLTLPPPPPPPGPLRPADLPLDVLLADDALVALDKPPGLTVHPGAGNRDQTLVNILLHHYGETLSSEGGEERPGIVHRLDKDTSGVILVARTDPAHRHLSRQFHDRTTQKLYLALVKGDPPDATEVTAPLGRHPKDRKKQAVVSDGRAAHTAFRVRERWPGYALVEARPRTGRTHQIRVHLKSIGCPIVADATYGGGERLTRKDLGLEPDGPLLKRQALHAHRLEFEHPTSRERTTVEAPLPADMRAAVDALRERFPRS